LLLLFFFFFFFFFLFVFCFVSLQQVDLSRCHTVFLLPIALAVAVATVAAVNNEAPILSYAPPSLSLQVQAADANAVVHTHRHAKRAASCGGVTVTQNVDDSTVRSQSGVSCNAGGVNADTFLARFFNFPVATFVKCVDFGVELNNLATNVRVRLYTQAAGTSPVTANMVLIAGSEQFVAIGVTTLSIHTASYPGNGILVPAGNVVVELFTPDRVSGDGGKIFLGSNNAGQTGPTFYKAPLCGTTDFVNLANVGFSDSHLLLRLGTGPATASGDPHLKGLYGIEFDVFGKPAANYSLLVAPAFEINMQLADRGPEMRFMTSMAVLYQGKSFIITPWTVTSSAELIAHFEALGAKVDIDTPNWIITIELCAQHTIAFATRHSDNINFLNLEVRVPGCHNAYTGLLGQTYQCKYANENFEWSREREEAFRIATLETPSAVYSPLATCAHEDEYRGEPMRGGSIGGGNDALSMTTTLERITA
jgi:hypothetical protein